MSDKFIPITPYIREFHYKDVCLWWIAHGWPVIEEDFLPTTGAVVPGVAAGFIYLTDSKIAMLEWIVSNPKAGIKEIHASIKAIIEWLLNFAREQGYEAMFTYSRSRGLINVLEAADFKVTDTQMTHLLWRG